jgi:hypothetical protein
MGITMIEPFLLVLSHRGGTRACLTAELVSLVYHNPSADGNFANDSGGFAHVP